MCIHFKGTVKINIMKKLVITPLESQKDGRLLFLTCFIFYTLINTGRLNYSAAASEITLSGFMPKDQAGLISTALFVTYGVGQFINGFISDRLPPFGMVFCGFFFGGIANLAMYAAFMNRAPLIVYIVVWALNGYVQSMIWPTMIRIVSMFLPERQRVSAGVGMLASSSAGTVLAYLATTLSMRFFGWRKCFLVPSVLLVVSSIVWLVMTRRFSRLTISYTETDASDVRTSAAKKSADKNKLLPLMISSGTIFMVIPVAMMAFSRDSIQNWAPTYLSELFGTEPFLSVLMSTVIPLVGIFGATLGKIVSDRIRDEMRSASLLFLLASLPIAGMAFLPKNLVAMLVMISMTVMFSIGVHTMFVSLVPMRFVSCGRSATMTGILNSTAAICGGLSNYISGVIAESIGWNAVFTICLTLMLIGSASSLMISRRWIRFKRG